MKLQEKLDACSSYCQDLNERFVKQSEVIKELCVRIEELEASVEWLEENDEDEENEEEQIDAQEEFNLKVKALANTALSYSPSADYAFYLLSSSAANIHSLIVEQSKEST